MALLAKISGVKAAAEKPRKTSALKKQNASARVKASLIALALRARSWRKQQQPATVWRSAAGAASLQKQR
jgi:hypothetical protein